MRTVEPLCLPLLAVYNCKVRNEGIGFVCGIFSRLQYQRDAFKVKPFRIK